MFTTSSQISGSPIATNTGVGRRRALRRLAVAALLAGNLATVGLGAGALSGAVSGSALEHATAASVIGFTPVPIPRPTINPQPLPPGHVMPLPTINP